MTKPWYSHCWKFSSKFNSLVICSCLPVHVCNQSQLVSTSPSPPWSKYQSNKKLILVGRSSRASSMVRKFIGAGVVGQIPWVSRFHFRIPMKNGGNVRVYRRCLRIKITSIANNIIIWRIEMQRKYGGVLFALWCTFSFFRRLWSFILVEEHTPRCCPRWSLALALADCEWRAVRKNAV